MRRLATRALWHIRSSAVAAWLWLCRVFLGRVHGHVCGHAFTSAQWLALPSVGLMFVDERFGDEAPYAFELVNCTCGSTLAGIRFDISRGRFGPMSEHEIAAVERCEREVIEARFNAAKQRRAA